MNSLYSFFFDSRCFSCDSFSFNSCFLFRSGKGSSSFLFYNGFLFLSCSLLSSSKCMNSLLFSSICSCLFIGLHTFSLFLLLLLFLSLFVKLAVCDFLLNRNCFFNLSNLSIEIANLICCLGWYLFFSFCHFNILDWCVQLLLFQNFLLCSSGNLAILLLATFFMITNCVFWILRLWANTFIFHFLILLRNEIQNILTFTIFLCNQNLLRKLLLFVLDRLGQLLLLSENFWLNWFTKKNTFIF